MNCLFRCDQCRYEEWRPEEQEPWLCLVCGYMRWGVVATDGGDEQLVAEAEDVGDSGDG